MTRRRWAIAALGVATVLLAGALWAAWSLSPARLKAHALSELSDRLGLDVTLDDVSVSLFPAATISGRGLVLRVPDHRELPPFISIERFRVDAGLLTAFGRHFHTAHLEGLKITIPPSDVRDELPSTRQSSGASRILIDRIETPNAELTVLRRKPGDPPLVFQIHELTLTDVGFDRRMPFHAMLTNPLPQGLVDSTGHVGPFPKGRPSELPVSGDYSFTSADLEPIPGIAGTLNSTGHYDGVVSRIDVAGHSETPDFTLDLGGRPLPLTAAFQTVVDGTDGSTRLEQVRARLLNTDIQVSGLIDNLPGPGNHDVTLDARIAQGRIEDLLRLFSDSPPALTGDVVLDARIAMPPGPARVRDRLQVGGRVHLAAAHFNKPEIQAKVAELSRRSRGKAGDAGAADVFSDVRSAFELGDGVLNVTNLNFQVPGAVIRLRGTYKIATGRLDLEGEARLDAPLSDVVGGWKGLLVKPFDFVFKRGGAGAVVPIAISGTRNSPELSIRFGATFKRATNEQ